MDDATARAVLCILGGGVAAQWIAWRLRLPAIVLLFGLGLVLGPALGWLVPSRDFGTGYRPLIGLAVAVIVFEGGLALNLHELREAGRGVLRLTVVALPISFVLSALAARLVGGFDWPIAAVYGAVLVVTGPTVILPLLRIAGLTRHAASLLKWEAIVNDPVGAILTGLILEVLLSRAHGTVEQPWLFGLHVAGGAAASAGLGAGVAIGLASAFRRDKVPELLKTPILIAAALGVAVLSNLVLDEGGLIAATVLGVMLANLDVPGLSELRRFKEALVVLLVSSLFIVLTADLDPGLLMGLSWRVLALTAVMLVLVRPATIALATAFGPLSWQERALVGWIAPRGIVAAATAGVAGLRLQEAQYAGAELVQPAVFAVIAVTVVAHGLSLKPLARRLGLSRGDHVVVAILGASPWSIDLAAVLARAGVEVMMIDRYAGSLRPAQALGLAVLRAEMLSRRAEEALAGQHIDMFLAATPDPIYNALACARLAPEVGRERVYQITTGHQNLVHPERGLSRDWRGKMLAAPELDADELARRHEAGARFRLVEAGDIVEPGAVPLLVLRAGRSLDVAAEGHPDLDPLNEGDRAVVLGAVPG